MRMSEALSLIKDQDEKIIGALLCYSTGLDPLGILVLSEAKNERDALVL